MSFIYVSCAPKNNLNVLGTYKSQRPSKAELLTYYFQENSRSSIMGQELVLREDSTYSYKTCGHIIKGSWKVIDGKMILSEHSKRWKSDSLNRIAYPIGNPPNRFFDFNIKDQKLISFFKDSLSNNLIVNQLKKVE